MDKKPNIGGQAVIEGVMMRNANAVATAVREPSGTITVKNEKIISIAERFPILKKPMLRGVVALGESLVVGLKALSYSAQMAGDEGETLSDKEIVLTMIFSLCLTIVLFVIIPTAAAKYVHSAIKDPMLLNLAEGGLRMLIFFLYIYGISRMKDIKRVFQYHGAEHKSIYNYESGKELSVENARMSTRLHPRCGTSFLLLVMFISIIVFSLVDTLFPLPKNIFLLIGYKIFTRVPFVPIVAGISYEIQRWTSYRLDNISAKMISIPGMWLQKITTKEPDDSQIEVALVALNVALGNEVKNAIEVFE